MIISTEQEEFNESDNQSNCKIKRALVSAENAQMLQNAEGCLGSYNNSLYLFLYLHSTVLLTS